MGESTERPTSSSLRSGRNMPNDPKHSVPLPPASPLPCTCEKAGNGEIIKYDPDCPTKPHAVTAMKIAQHRDVDRGKFIPPPVETAPRNPQPPLKRKELPQPERSWRFSVPTFLVYLALTLQSWLLLDVDTGTILLFAATTIAFAFISAKDIYDWWLNQEPTVAEVRKALRYVETDMEQRIRDRLPHD